MKDGERLYGLPGPLEKLSHLITSSVGRGYRGEEKLTRLERIETRLERLEPQLAQFKQRTGSNLAQLEQKAQSNLAQLESKLAQFEQRTESKFAELKHQTSEVQALGQRLDSDVVKGFAALVSR